MKIIYNKSQEKCDELVVSLLQKAVNKMLQYKDKEYIVIGIPGGRSVEGIFKLLKNVKLPWEKIHIFWVDERIVPLTSADSNYYQANNIFLKELVQKKKINQQNIHPFQNGIKYGIRYYQKELQQYGSKFDIMLLGVGEDGHIASLFPCAFNKENNDGNNDASLLFLLINNSLKLPKKRITVSPYLLQKSEVIFLFFYGDNKKIALNNFLDDKLSSAECPVKLSMKVKQLYLATNLKNPALQDSPE